jgi:hypothetical protein
MVGVISLWTKGNKPHLGFENKDALIYAILCCTHYMNKHHEQIIAVTDTDGAKILTETGVNFAAIYTDFDKITTSPEFWAVAKLQAYKIAAKKYGGFVHYDIDVFSQKKYTPSENGIIAQSMENDAHYNFMHEKMLRTCNKLPNIFLKGNPEIAINTGIFGVGSEAAKKIIKCFSEAEKIIKDNDFITYSKNEKLWVNMMIEQFFITSYAKANGIVIDLVIQDITNPEEAISKGYCHLWGGVKRRATNDLKNKAQILEFERYKKVVSK